MKITLYQVVVLGVSSVMLFQGAKDYFKREAGQTSLKFLVRVIVWGGMGVIAIFPNTTEFIAKLLGFKENINAVIIVGFLFVFMLIFKLLSAIEKIEQNISELTRSEALSHLKSPLKIQQNSIDSEIIEELSHQETPLERNEKDKSGSSG